jgi:toxin CptA
MSHDAYANPLVLEPRRSRYLFIYLCVVHTMALLALAVPINLPLFPRFGIATLVIFSFIRQLRRLPPQCLVWEADGEWQLFYADGNKSTGQLRADSYVSTLLVVLCFRLQSGGTRSVVILPDMLDPQSMRRLRVRLLQARLAETAEDTGI